MLSPSFYSNYLLIKLFISVKSLCGLEASQGVVEEVLTSAVICRVTTETLDSSDDLDPEEDGINENKVYLKKKNKRRKGLFDFYL